MGSKIGINGKLQAFIKDAAKQCEDEEKARKKSEQVQWLMPPLDEWQGDPFDWEGMHKPFDSIETSDQFIDEVWKPFSIGAAGDLPLANLQVDYLTALERAFRARHTTSFPRAVAHHCLRRKGQGDKHGPLRYGLLDYLKDLKKVTAG